MSDHCISFRCITGCMSLPNCIVNSANPERRPDCCPFDSTLKVRFIPATDDDMLQWKRMAAKTLIEQDLETEVAAIMEWEAMERKRLERGAM